jgi:hypothetical protein
MTTAFAQMMSQQLSAVQKSTEDAFKIKPAAKVQATFEKGSIAATIMQGLRAGKAPKKILETVLKKHEGANTTIACVYWYKSRLNRGLVK